MDEDKKPAPARMSVTGTHTVMLDADGAELFITVQGSQFFGGTSAMNQARELATLVAALKEAGLSESDIQLQSAQLEQSDGFGKGSSALYTLKLVCRPATKVGDVLTVLSQQKNVRLDRTVWTFPDDDEAVDQWLEEATKKGRRRAERRAAATGVRLVRVLGIAVGSESAAPLHAPQSAALFRGKIRSRHGDDDLLDEMALPEVHHQKRVTLHVNIDYELGAFLDAPV